MDLSQVDENVIARLDNRSCVTCCAFGVDELNRIDELTTTVALISFGVSKATTIKRAATTDHSIGKWSVASLAELLFNVVLISVTLRLKVVKDILSDFSLLGCRGSSEIVEVAIEPLVNFGV